MGPRVLMKRMIRAQMIFLPRTVRGSRRIRSTSAITIRMRSKAKRGHSKPTGAVLCIWVIRLDSGNSIVSFFPFLKFTIAASFRCPWVHISPLPGRTAEHLTAEESCHQRASRLFQPGASQAVPQRSTGTPREGMGGTTMLSLVVARAGSSRFLPHHFSHSGLKHELRSKTNPQQHGADERSGKTYSQGNRCN